MGPKQGPLDAKNNLLVFGAGVIYLLSASPGRGIDIYS